MAKRDVSKRSLPFVPSQNVWDKPGDYTNGESRSRHTRLSAEVPRVAEWFLWGSARVLSPGRSQSGTVGVGVDFCVSSSRSWAAA